MPQKAVAVRTLLNLESLEVRANPAFPYGPGTVPWDADLIDTQVVTGDLDGDGRLSETMFVAQEGGSCRVVVRDDAGRLLADWVFFDPNFRGGGKATVVERDGQDLIVVTPGVGGGPIVNVRTLDGSVNHTFWAFDSAYRGGLEVLGARTDGGYNLLAWPKVAPPNLRLFDAQSGQVLRSVWMAPQDQTDWGVAPVGVFADGVYVDRGDTGGLPNPTTRFVPWDGEEGGGGPISV